MPNLPWQIKPTIHTVTDESGAVSMEVPDYGSLLVCEVEFLTSLPDNLADDNLTNTFVPYCLRVRFDLPDEVSDAEILKRMPIALRTALFLFFIYGKSGKPKGVATPTKAKKHKNPSVGQSDSGDFSSITPVTPISPQEPTDEPRSGSSLKQLPLTRKSA